MKRYIAELIGTFALVFCGTGAIIINDVSGGTVTHPGVAITFGLIVMAMIYAFGSTSGAHINPAVSIAFSLTGIFKLSEVVPYIVAQLMGAILASALLAYLFPTHEGLGATLPAGSWQQSFILELLLTYFLMLVIVSVSQNTPIAVFTGLAVGGTVLLEAMFAGPITGASMNPARSIGPALVSGNMDVLWLYILAPIIGAVLASLTWIFLIQKEDE
ncbi:MAG: MIP/aquaporin family protein [Bacteroidia bacterium]